MGHQQRTTDRHTTGIWRDNRRGILACSYNTEYRNPIKKFLSEWRNRNYLLCLGRHRVGRDEPVALEQRTDNPGDPKRYSRLQAVLAYSLIRPRMGCTGSPIWRL